MSSDTAPVASSAVPKTLLPNRCTKHTGTLLASSGTGGPNVGPDPVPGRTCAHRSHSVSAVPSQPLTQASTCAFITARKLWASPVHPMSRSEPLSPNRTIRRSGPPSTLSQDVGHVSHAPAGFRRQYSQMRSRSVLQPNGVARLPTRVSLAQLLFFGYGPRATVTFCVAPHACSGPRTGGSAELGRPPTSRRPSRTGAQPAGWPSATQARTSKVHLPSQASALIFREVVWTISFEVSTWKPFQQSLDETPPGSTTNSARATVARALTSRATAKRGGCIVHVWPRRSKVARTMPHRGIGPPAPTGALRHRRGRIRECPLTPSKRESATR